MATGMTQAEYARKIGVSRPYVCKLVKQGRVRFKNGLVYPDTVESKGENGTERKLSVPRVGKAQPGGGGGYYAAKTVVEEFNGAMKELEYHERVGTLVRVDEVSKAAFDTAQKVRGLLNALPERLCHVLAAEGDSEEVRLLLETEIRQIEDELTNRFSRRNLPIGVRDGDPA